MFRIIFLVTSSVGLAAALHFTDCATDKSNTALTVHELDFSPATILFPGELYLTINATVNKRITHLFVDVVLEKTTLLVWTKVPCIASTNIGSCANIDSCTILDKILNGSSVLSAELGRQIDAILLSALGHKAHCPIEPENVYIQNEKLILQALPGLLAPITSGHYRIKISVKDDPTNPDNAGCIQFEADIGRGVSQPGVG